MDRNPFSPGEGAPSRELGPYRTGDIAHLLIAKIDSLGKVRANLIRKGMIYSPPRGGISVPLFDDFMIRTVSAP